MPSKVLNMKAIADFFRGPIKRHRLRIVTLGVLAFVAIGSLAVAWYINRPTVTEPLPLRERTIVVGCTDNFPPFDLRDKNGKHIGYAREISTEVARELGYAIEYKTSPHWVEVVEWLKNGEIDLIHLIAYSRERDEYFDFTIPHTLVPEVISVRSERLDIRGLDDLEGKQIGAIRGHITHEKLLKYEGLNITVFETPQEGVEALLDRKVDAFVYPQYVFTYLVRQMRRKDEIKTVGEPSGHLRYGMAVRKGDNVLLSYLDRAIQRIEATGKQDEIARHWFGREIFLGLTREGVLNLIRWAMFGLFVTSLGGLAYIYGRHKLQKAEAVLCHNLIFRHMDDSVILTGLDGNITDWNPGAERIFGYSREEILGRRLNSLVAPEGSTELFETIIREVQEGGIWSGEIRAVRKDGSQVECSVRTTALRNEKGDITAYVSIIGDITELKQAEQALQEAREYAESIVETVRGPLVVLDADLRVISANHSFFQTFRMTAEETQGQLLYDLGNRQWDIPALRELLEKILPENTSFENFEMEHEFSIIGRRTMLLNARRIYKELNKTQMILIAIEDITKRKRAEERTHRQSAVLVAINRVFQETLTCETEEEVASMCLAVTEELTGSKFGCIGEVNQAGRFDTIALSDPSWDACRIPESNAVVMIKDMEIRGIWGRVLKDGKSLIVNDPSTHPDWVGIPEGHPPLTSFLGVPLKHAGGTIGIIALANSESGYDLNNQQDVETLSVTFVEALMRKRAEEALRKAHDELEDRVAERTEEFFQANIRLKEMDRLKSEFLANMSHELRTPLNSIIGFTGIILQGIPGELNEEQKKQLSMVYGSAKHLLALINDILELSRIESGKMEISTERLKIQDVVSEVSQSLSPMISRKGLRLITEIPDETPEIYSDRKKVLQILLNLISNAVKFTQAGEVRIECKFDNDNLEVSVADTGIGIKKAAMKLLFEAFRQIDGRAQRRYQGAGLGLYLCQKLVTQLGGNIWAESEYGKGSKFTFTLPLRCEERGE